MIFRNAQFDESGAITQILTAPYGFIEADESVNDATHYVDVPTRTIHAKQECAPIITVSGLFVVITALPIPCTLIVHNDRHDITDGIAELSFNYPGEYNVVVESVKSLRWSGKVTL